MTPTTYSSSYEPCHSGNVKIFDYGKGSLYAGGWSKGMHALFGGIMIDLTGSHFSDAATGRKQGDIAVMDVQSKKFFQDFLDHVYPPHDPVYWMKMNIVDFGIPTWEDSVWTDLAAFLSQKMMEGTNVVIGCMGGHGRTGLAVSILAQLMVPELTGDDPIIWLRKIYCKNAVENKKQIEYVYKIVGEPATGVHAPEPEHKNWAQAAKTPTRTRDPLEGECAICLEPLQEGESTICLSCFSNEYKGYSKSYTSSIPCQCWVDSEKYQAYGDNKKICDTHMDGLADFYGFEIIERDIKGSSKKPKPVHGDPIIDKLKINKGGKVFKGTEWPSIDHKSQQSFGSMKGTSSVSSKKYVCSSCGNLYENQEEECAWCKGEIIPRKKGL